MIFCSKCGKKLEPDDEFCQKCGTKIKSRSGEDGNVSVSHNKKKLPLWVFIIILIGTFFLATIPILYYIFGIKVLVELDALVLFGTFIFGIFGGVLLFYQLSSKIRGYSMIIPISLIISLLIDVILFTNILSKDTGILLLAFVHAAIFILTITVMVYQKSK